MATYVNDLRLKEIATGDEAGTWGTSTNTNLQLIGEALGYGTQDCFASDADATTTVADGATDPARAMYFKVTSSATLTATRTLTIAPNTVSRVMLIENATTGSQSIAISQGSGGNVTIASGQTKMVYLDGAGSGAAVVDALADLELGTITVANLTATTADINGGTIDGVTIGGASAGAGTFTTLNATGGGALTGTWTDLGSVTTVDINGGTIDGVTIGGASAGAGSFTTLTTSSTVTHNGGTANGVAYLNGSKALTTGSALTFDGSTLTTSNANASFTSGTSGTAGVITSGAAGTQGTIQFGSSQTTYNIQGGPDYLGNVYNVATSHSHQWSIAASEQMRLDSAGNLGLGVTPSAWNNAYKVFQFGTVSNLQQGATSDTSIANNYYVNSAGNAVYLTSNYASAYRQASGAHEWYTTASGTAGNTISFTQAMTLDASGNLGIGESSVSQRLDVKTSTVNTGMLVYNTNTASGASVPVFLASESDGSTTNVSVENTGAGNMVFRTGATTKAGYGTERMRVDASGNVGIGTASPNEQVEISFTDAAVSLRVNSQNAGVSASNYSEIQLADNGAVRTYWRSLRDGSGQTAFSYNDHLSFQKVGAEVARIDSSGRLLVGTTSGSFGSRITALSTTSYLFESRRTGTGSEGQMVFVNGNGAVGSIFTNGSATAYNTSSDARLKENIADAEDAGAKVDAIQVRQFDWKADGAHQDYGMIAQELMTVAPEAVSGDPESDDMMGVDYSKLVPMLVKEIQSLRARVHALEGK